MNIKILTTTRSKDTLIPQYLIRENEELLVGGINDYIRSEKLEPIYIDGCIAIFEDKLMIAVYEEEFS